MLGGKVRRKKRPARSLYPMVEHVRSDTGDDLPACPSGKPRRTVTEEAVVNIVHSPQRPAGTHQNDGCSRGPTGNG